MSLCLDLVLWLCWVVCVTVVSALWDSELIDAESDWLVRLVFVDDGARSGVIIVWNRFI